MKDYSVLVECMYFALMKTEIVVQGEVFSGLIRVYREMVSLSWGLCSSLHFFIFEFGGLC